MPLLLENERVEHRRHPGEEARCRAFLTNDRRLPAMPGLTVRQLSSYVT